MAMTNKQIKNKQIKDKITWAQMNKAGKKFNEKNFGNLSKTLKKVLG